MNLIPLCYRRIIGYSLGLVFSFPLAHAATHNLLQLSLNDLLGVKIRAVGKKPQQLSEIPAAVFIITHSDIRQAGVRTIPDLLRMVPGMHINQLNSHAWEISARGFNQLLANKMLVMVDGRSVHVREFSGVWWEQLNLIVDDIDHIEVVRGPGGTAWGSNAVNGVVNIITKTAKDTQGGLLNIALGDQLEYLSSVRYGDKIGKKTYMRLYAQTRSEQTVDALIPDPYQNSQVGFRIDGNYTSKDKWTLQGDYYQGRSAEIDMTRYDSAPEYSDFYGMNILGRWQRDLGYDNEFQAQIYIDQYLRDPKFVSSQTHTIDLDMQHRFHLNPEHEIVWGLDWRRYQNKSKNSDNFQFSPTEYSENLFSLFVQDEITLAEKSWYLTLGTKFEHVQNIGWEVQPSARLLWTPTAKRSFWGAISRAVRMPDWGISRATWKSYYPSHITGIPLIATIFPNSQQIRPESLIAYELGWRETWGKNLFVDANVYYHDYKDIIDTVTLNETFSPKGLLVGVSYQNLDKQHSYGAELAVSWQAKKNWKLQGAYTYIHDYTFAENRQSQPKHQFSLRSHWQINSKWSFNTWLRHYHRIDQGDVNFGYLGVPAHTDLDLRLNWHVRRNLELSLNLNNALTASHDESHWNVTSQLYIPSQRQVYAQLHWRF